MLVLCNEHTQSLNTKAGQWKVVVNVSLCNRLQLKSSVQLLPEVEEISGNFGIDFNRDGLSNLTFLPCILCEKHQTLVLNF